MYQVHVNQCTIIGWEINFVCNNNIVETVTFVLLVSIVTEHTCKTTCPVTKTENSFDGGQL